MPKVYLAGPMVFEKNAEKIFLKMKKICQLHGLEGVAPLDNQNSISKQKTGKDLTLKIVQADFDLIDRLDGGIFCLNPFRRSTEMDPGTAVEIGYMKAQNKPIVGWTTDHRDYQEKVKDHFNNLYDLSLNKDSKKSIPTSGQLRDPDGLLVHSEGMLQNGMTQGAIELSGGHVYYSADWEEAFKLAANALAYRLK